MRKHSFAPVSAAHCTKLILGSLPGEESLRQGRYYAHRANHFWRLVYEVHGAPAEEDYDARLAFLLGRGIALWDVLESAQRQGSLDASIREEQPNDFDAFFAQCPRIERVFFNGSKAHDAFARNCQEHYARLACVRLPSSSPIPGRGRRYEDKLAAWRALVDEAPGIER